MKLIWFTCRSMVDLCATTQLALASGLVERNHQLLVINPDEQGTHREFQWSHVGLPIKARRGFQSRAIGLKMKKWMETHDFAKEDIALIDWRIAKHVVPKLESLSISWVLIDRSPPADSGIFSMLQWPFWKKAWLMVKKNKQSQGCVVSNGHKSLVIEKTKVSPNKITILHAGVNLELFKPKKRYTDLTLIYHGQIDEHRGVLSLPIMIQKANDSGLRCRLIMIGEGNAYSKIEQIMSGNKNMELHSTMEQNKLAEFIAQCHVGLLPMPELKVWMIASPLKRSEYAASGLLILGIDHAGHRFEGNEKLEWVKLVKQYSFDEESIKWLKSLDTAKIQLHGQKARTFAETNLSWSHTVDALEEVLQNSFE